jgi:uncharacterized protein YndB with AHSA1/START domain
LAFQEDRESIVWRVHFASSPDEVYEALDSDSGRASFWAESAVERHGVVRFRFINGVRFDGRILERERPHLWSVDYFSSTAQFTLRSDGADGTDLTLSNDGVDDRDRAEVTAGWLNVLLPMKAWVDYQIDLRSHDRNRTWDHGYVDQ